MNKDCQKKECKDCQKNTSISDFLEKKPYCENGNSCEIPIDLSCVCWDLPPVCELGINTGDPLSSVLQKLILLGKHNACNTSLHHVTKTTDNPENIFGVPGFTDSYHFWNSDQESEESLIVTIPVTNPNSSSDIEDTNTWNIQGVAFIAPWGDDETAVVGDGNKPFKTLDAVYEAVDLNTNYPPSHVYVLPGQYYGYFKLMTNYYYHFYDGAIMNGTVGDDGFVVANSRITGYLRFAYDSGGFDFRGQGTTVDIKMHSFDRAQRLVHSGHRNQIINIAFEYGTITCYNGAAQACRIFENSKINLVGKHYLHIAHFLISDHSVDGYNPSGTPGVFTLKVPELKTLDTIIPNYGSEYKSLIFFRDMWPLHVKLETDYESNANTSTISFGEEDAIIATCKNAENKVKLIGNYDANMNHGIYTNTFNSGPTFKLFNGSLKSKRNAVIVDYGGGSNNGRLYFKNFKIESENQLTIGPKYDVEFENCTISIRSSTSGATGVIERSSESPTVKSNIMMYDTKIHAGTAGLVSVYGNDTNLNFHSLNCFSNVDIDSSLTDQWNSLTVIPNLTIPKI